MSPAIIFSLQLVLGYVPWLLFLRGYVWPKFRSKAPIEAHRAIAMLHSFRFFGLVFILPGVVGAQLPAGFGVSAAYGDFATGLLAMLALALAGIKPLFWVFTVAFNLVGAADLIINYFHGATLNLPSLSGQLGAAYFIPIIYVPLLMTTHVVALHLLVRSRHSAARASLPARVRLSETRTASGLSGRQ